MTDRTNIAGDVDYSIHGVGYAQQRKTDPRIATLVHDALGNARTVLNVGAGAGSYEPLDRHVIAIEPSTTMRAQRPAHLAPAIHGVAESLPLDDQSIDASMAMTTIHQWKDFRRGVEELKRVTRGPIVILTFDGSVLSQFWLTRYAPELMAAEEPRYPAVQSIVDCLGGPTSILTVPIPIDCTDGFMEAFYARPERLLDPAVRRSQSSWTFISEKQQTDSIDMLREEIESGAWDGQFGSLRVQPFFEGSLKLITSIDR